jgi:hypothetical protein
MSMKCPSKMSKNSIEAGEKMREFEVVVTTKSKTQKFYYVDAQDFDAALSKLEELRNAGFFETGDVFDVKESA